MTSFVTNYILLPKEIFFRYKISNRNKLQIHYIKQNVTMKRITLFTVLALTIVATGQAKVKLPSILADHMVMQQQEKVKLWGSSDRKGQLDITTSWNGQKYQAQISTDGRWEVLVETGKAGGPYQITFDDGDRTQLEDIYLGEVWLCSGQSNMEMPVKGFAGHPASFLLVSEGG